MKLMGIMSRANGFVAFHFYCLYSYYGSNSLKAHNLSAQCSSCSVRYKSIVDKQKMERKKERKCAIAIITYFTRWLWLCHHLKIKFKLKTKNETCERKKFADKRIREWNALNFSACLVWKLNKNHKTMRMGDHKSFGYKHKKYCFGYSFFLLLFGSSSSFHVAFGGQQKHYI